MESLKRKTLHDEVVPEVNNDDKTKKEKVSSKDINIRRPKIGALYTHKGGVGKTTIVLNIARKIAIETKMKILVIDSDPQMNLTSWVMSDPEFDNHLQRESTVRKEVKDPSSIMELYYAHDSYKLNPRKYKEVFILPGSFEDFDLETYLSLALFKKNSGDLQFKVLRERVRNQLDYDMILLDLSPSLSPLNVSMLLSCDFLINVVTADTFCEKSFELQNINLYDRFKKTPMEILLPKHLGFIMNRCRIQNEERTADVIAFESKFNRICKRHEIGKLIGWLEDLAGMNIRLHLFKVDLIDYQDADVKKNRRVKEQFVGMVTMLLKLID